MTNYFRITAYHPEQNISVIMDSYGKFAKLWQFSAYMVQKGFKVLAVGNDETFFDGVGLGYRAPFIKRLADELYSGALDLESYKELSAAELKKALKRIYGVGQKVADCAILFGFHKSDCFPVDVWLEKVYRENFNGTLTDREKISEWFVQKFGEDSGFFQQYLFYYKRVLESVRTNEN